MMKTGIYLRRVLIVHASPKGIVVHFLNVMLADRINASSSEAQMTCNKNGIQNNRKTETCSKGVK